MHIWASLCPQVIGLADPDVEVYLCLRAPVNLVVRINSPAGRAGSAGGLKLVHIAVTWVVRETLPGALQDITDQLAVDSLRLILRACTSGIREEPLALLRIDDLELESLACRGDGGGVNASKKSAAGSDYYGLVIFVPKRQEGGGEYGLDKHFFGGLSSGLQ